MTSKNVYNAQVKLTASLVNLVAVGLVTAGVTTPLVGAFYGHQLWSVSEPEQIVGAFLLWLGGGLGVHIVALLILRDLIE